MKKKGGCNSCRDADGFEKLRHNPAVLARVGQEARAAYIDLRRAFESRATGAISQYLPGPFWDGGVVWRAGRRIQRTAIWPKIAQVCLNNEIDPLDYVRAQFIGLAGYSRTPAPNCLLGQRALDNYYRMFPRGAVALKIEQDFAAEKTALATSVADYLDGGGLTLAEVRRTVLCNETIALSPLLRYCLARSEGEKKIAAAYFEAAAMQYFRHPSEYSQVMRGWLPDDFATLAAKYCSEMYARMQAESDHEDY